MLRVLKRSWLLLNVRDIVLAPVATPIVSGLDVASVLSVVLVVRLRLRKLLGMWLLKWSELILTVTLLHALSEVEMKEVQERELDGRAIEGKAVVAIVVSAVIHVVHALIVVAIGLVVASTEVRVARAQDARGLTSVANGESDSLGTHTDLRHKA